VAVLAAATATLAMAVAVAVAVRVVVLAGQAAIARATPAAPAANRVVKFLSVG
jgi:hypothetical protein